MATTAAEGALARGKLADVETHKQVATRVGGWMMSNGGNAVVEKVYCSASIDAQADLSINLGGVGSWGRCSMLEWQ